MTLEDIKEVKECRAVSKVNRLLKQGDWRLLNVIVDKVTVSDGEREVGESMTPFSFSKKYEIAYEEKLSVLYVLGKYK